MPINDKGCKSQSFTRRGFIKGVSATTALLTAVNAAFPAGVHAQGSGPEVDKAVLGFIGLTDAAPLIIAKEKGFFAKHGVPNVTVVRQASWSFICDGLATSGTRDRLDGAHIFSTLPYLLAADKVPGYKNSSPLYLLARLNLDCQAIAVATEYQGMGIDLNASVLDLAFDIKADKGFKLTAALTYRGSTDELWLRYWLAAAGIDPISQVEMIVVPPVLMVEDMQVYQVDVFAVGEPWAEQFSNSGVGFTACTTSEIWPKHPEKAFVMRAGWVDKYPRAARAITMAVLEAQQWCDKAKNRDELATIICGPKWLKVPVKDVVGRLRGDINYGRGRIEKGTKYGFKFWQDHASYPFKSHDLWFLTENIRWGVLPVMTNMEALIDRVNREDIWREAAKGLGLPASAIPASTSRGIEKFFDGKKFDPANPLVYLASLDIKSITQ